VEVELIAKSLEPAQTRRLATLNGNNHPVSQ